MRGARLASDKISVETQGTSVPLFLNGSPPPPLPVWHLPLLRQRGECESSWPAGSCCSRADSSSRWVTNPGTESCNSLFSPQVDVCTGWLHPQNLQHFLSHEGRMLQCKGSNQIDGLKQVPDPGQALTSAKWLIWLCLISLDSGTPPIRT